MNDLHISSVIQRERHARGITQGELARHLGVTAAAVSKWEQGSSLPDTMLLPAIAAYFQISVDELLDYHPELTDREIDALCSELRDRFRQDPDAAYDELCDAARRHFSCWKLLLELARLLVAQRSQEALRAAKATDDTSETAGACDRVRIYADKVIELCERVEEGGVGTRIATSARIERANLLLVLGRGDEAIAALEGLVPDAPDRATPILAIAYQIQGKPDQARHLLQQVTFWGAHATILSLTLQLSLAESPEHAEALVDAACAVDDALGTTRLLFSQAVGLYTGAAQHFMAHGQHERALDMFERFADRVESIAGVVRQGKAPDLSPLYENIGELIAQEASREDKNLRDDAFAALRLASEKGFLADPMWDAVRETRRFRLAAARLSSALA